MGIFRIADKKMGMIKDLIVFEQYEIPQGFLINHRAPDGLACHGLMYYSLIGKNSYEIYLKEMVLEGEQDPEVDLRSLFKSVARLYNTEPEVMQKFWFNVRMQWDQLGLTQPPEVVQQAMKHLKRISNILSPEQDVPFLEKMKFRALN